MRRDENGFFYFLGRADDVFGGARTSGQARSSGSPVSRAGISSPFGATHKGRYLGFRR